MFCVVTCCCVVLVLCVVGVFRFVYVRIISLRCVPLCYGSVLSVLFRVVHVCLVSDCCGAVWCVFVLVCFVVLLLVWLMLCVFVCAVVVCGVVLMCCADV